MVLCGTLENNEEFSIDLQSLYRENKTLFDKWKDLFSLLNFFQRNEIFLCLQVHKRIEMQPFANWGINAVTRNITHYTDYWSRINKVSQICDRPSNGIIYWTIPFIWILLLTTKIIVGMKELLVFGRNIKLTCNSSMTCEISWHCSFLLTTIF